MTRISEVSSDSIDEISNYEYIKKFSKQMLKNSLFIGTFQEKRFVESLNSYRDVITIAREEEDFIKNLLAVKKKIDEDWLKKPWVGFTKPDTVGAPVGYNLWVVLKEEVFGKYWYKVKTVEFLQNEIRLKIDIIRPFKKEYSSSSDNSTNELSGNENCIDDFDFKTVLNELPLKFRKHLVYFYSVVLTSQNIKQSIIFISLLLVAMVTGGAHVIQYLLEYILKLVKELSGLIKAISPVLISCINMIGRTIFGFYSMIVALYKGKPKPQPVYNSYVNFDPQMWPDYRQRYNQYYSGQLPYYPAQRSGVNLTPIDY